MTVRKKSLGEKMEGRNGGREGGREKGKKGRKRGVEESKRKERNRDVSCGGLWAKSLFHVHYMNGMRKQR